MSLTACTTVGLEPQNPSARSPLCTEVPNSISILDRHPAVITHRSSAATTLLGGPPASSHLRIVARVKPQLRRDLLVRPALVLERMQVHVLSSFIMSPAVPSDRRRCLVARHAEGAATLVGGW